MSEAYILIYQKFVFLKYLLTISIYLVPFLILYILFHTIIVGIIILRRDSQGSPDDHRGHGTENGSELPHCGTQSRRGGYSSKGHDDCHIRSNKMPGAF